MLSIPVLALLLLLQAAAPPVLPVLPVTPVPPAPLVFCSVVNGIATVCTSQNEAALPQSSTNWMLAHMPKLDDPLHLPAGTLNGSPIAVGKDYVILGQFIFPYSFKAKSWQGAAVVFTYRFLPGL